MSLRLKTIIGIALIEAILLAILVSMTLQYLRSTNYDGLLKRASTTTTLFATTVQDAVLSYDLASLESFVQEVLTHPDLRYARVLDAQGRVFAQAGDSTLLNRPFRADTQVETIDDGVFDASAEIEESGVVYGRVEIGLDITSVNEKIEEARRWSALVASVEMAMVALFSFILGAYLTAQLRSLRQAARSISAGELTFKLNVKGRDEIAEVAQAFNAMAADLHEASLKRDEAEAELKALNARLEDRVKERTAELAEKNRALLEANEAIQTTQAKLLQSEKMATVGVLAAGVAHEINNPMGYILSNIRTLRDYQARFSALLTAYEALADASTEAQRSACLQQIGQLQESHDIAFIREDVDSLIDDSVEGAERVCDIVLGLKAFSHVDSANAMVPYDLNDCIQATLKVAHNELKYHCHIRQALSELPQTYCNPGQMNQVLLNLLINAGQAITGTGNIEVSSHYEDGIIELRVVDDGCGMDAEVIERLFDPFYTTKPVGQGTGLGLAISYGIIADHQGEILVESAPGKGSCFRVRLPVRVSPVQAPEAAAEAE